jgi:rfaE bifunctional protein kinase chain/domain
MVDEKAKQRLTALIESFRQRRILVVGDVVADRFTYGVISRVSREAPVLILQHEQTETIPGGAANCALNLAALGARVALVSAMGNDEAGQALLSRLQAAGVACHGLLLSEQLQTTTKMRVLAGHLHSPRQQVIRIDYDTPPLANPAVTKALMTHCQEQGLDSDAIIISDYNYGVVGEEVTATIRQAAARKALPVFVDSRFRLSSFAGFTSATPNEDEVEQLLGRIPAKSLAAAAEQLRAKLALNALLVTRGSRGMILLEEGVPALNLEAVGANEAVDVTGAGDTVIATYALAIASGASFPEAARLANHAGGLVVMKRGTASVNSQELADSVARQDQN